MRVNRTDPCRISALINTQLCVSTNSGGLSRRRHLPKYLSLPPHLCVFSHLSLSLSLPLSFWFFSGRKAPMLGPPHAFDLLSPFKECWPSACKTPGDLAESMGIREYPTVANKPSNRMASKQKKKKQWRKGQREYEVGSVRKKRMDEGGGRPGDLIKRGKEVKAGN